MYRLRKFWNLKHPKYFQKERQRQRKRKDRKGGWKRRFVVATELYLKVILSKPKVLKPNERFLART